MSKVINLDREILNRDGAQVTAKIKVPATKELDNGEVVEEQRFKSVVLTLGKALTSSVLTTQFAVELDEKMKRYRLFQKLRDGGEVEVSDEELLDLKKYVNEHYEVVFVGQIVDMLDE